MRAKYNSDGNKIGELDDGYYLTTKWIADKKGCYEVGEEKTDYVDMSQPRPCSYQKWNKDTEENETIPLVAPPSIDTSSTPPVEYRGMTIRQLLAVVPNIKRRCVPEGWENRQGELLTPETVTLYDVAKYIIHSYTKDKMESFVTCLPSTAGPQPPRWYASHWWGATVLDFVRCLEQHMRDFGTNGHREDQYGDDGSNNDSDHQEDADSKRACQCQTIATTDGDG